MALYTRYALQVDEAVGNDTQGSGSSATVKDSDGISGDTLVITNAGGGSTITKALGGTFAGPVIPLSDTLVCTDTVGGLGLFHVALVSADNLTLTTVETPATGTSIGNPWGVGGRFDTMARAALLVTPTNTNAGADDHVYHKAGTYTGTTKITWSKAGSRSRCLVNEGFTTTPGDGGFTTYDITATATVGFEPNAVDQHFRNFKITNSGAVTSWIGVSGAAGRPTLEHLWITGAGTGNVGISSSLIGLTIGVRLNVTASGANGYSSGGIHPVAFSIAHDIGADGIPGNLYIFHSIADSCGTGTSARGGFRSAGVTRSGLMFCTAYNQGTSGHGLSITDSATNTSTMALGSIFTNNASHGINRLGITASFPLAIEAYNDFFANGTAARNNAEDTTANDTVPTDLTLDPRFVNAAAQDFRIGVDLRGRAAQVFQVGGTSYLDMGAMQRQDVAVARRDMVGGTVG